jgi:isoleucyl-tRNA synthetase
MAPILPHTADEAWRALHRIEASDTDQSVHLTNLPETFGTRADAAWSTAIAMRESALRELEQVRSTGDLDNPLDAGLVVPDPEGVVARFDPVDLADLVGVSRIRADCGATKVRVEDLRSEPRCERSWKRDGTVRQRSDGGMLSDRDAQAVGVS